MNEQTPFASVWRSKMSGGLWGFIFGPSILGNTVFPEGTVNDLLMKDKAKETSFYSKLFGNSPDGQPGAAASLASQLIDLNISPTDAAAIAAELKGPRLQRYMQVHDKLRNDIPELKDSEALDTITELVLASAKEPSEALEALVSAVKSSVGSNLSDNAARRMAEDILIRSGAKSVDPAALEIIKEQYGLSDNQEGTQTAIVLLKTMGWQKLGLAANPWSTPLYARTYNDPLRYVRGVRKRGSLGAYGNRGRRRKARTTPRSSPYTAAQAASSGDFTGDFEGFDDPRMQADFEARQAFRKAAKAKGTPPRPRMSRRAKEAMAAQMASGLGVKKGFEFKTEPEE